MVGHPLVRVLCLAALLPAAAAAQTNVYRWVDKDGKVHYSDSPPPAQQEIRSSSQRRMGGGYVEVDNLPFATQEAMKRNPVTLYTGAACGDACDYARGLLSSRGIPFSEKDAQNNAAAREALVKLVGAPEVPTIAIGQNTIKGYGETEWQRALDAAGYPRTRLPGQPTAPREPERAPPTPPPAAQPEGGEPPKPQ